MITIIEKSQADSFRTAHESSWADRYLSRRKLEDVMISGLDHISTNKLGFDYMAWDYTSEFTNGMLDISNSTMSFEDLMEDNDDTPPLSGISDYRYTSGFGSYHVVQLFKNNFYSVCDDSLLNF